MTKIEGITIEINGETKKLTTAIKNLNTPINKVQNELKNVENLLKMNPGNVELLTRKEKALAQAVTDTKSKLQALEQAQEQANQTIAEGGEVSESQYAKLQSEIDKTKLKLQGLEEAQRSFSSVSAQQLAAVGEKVEDVGQKMENVGNKLKPVSAAATGAIVASTAVFTSYDDAMRQVQATMSANADEYSRLDAAAKEMGRTTRYSASEAAEALNYLALAGYDVDKSISTLPKVLQLAQAGGIDLAYASDMVTDSMSALGLQTDELDEFVDQLAKTSQKSNTNISQLGEAILTVGGTAKVLAGGTTEMNTALGLLADNGIKGAEGGTALRNVILSLTAPTDKAAAAMKQYGISALDAQGNMRPLEDVFMDLNSALGSLSDGEKTKVLNEIFNKVDLKSVNALMGTNIERWDELSDAIEQSNGAAADMAATMESGIGGTFREFKSALEGAAIAIGEALAPAIRAVTKVLTAMINAFTGLPSCFQTVVAVFLTLTAAIAPLLLLFGRLTVVAGQVMQFAPQISTAFSGISSVFTKLTPAFTGVFNAIKLVGGGLRSLLPVLGGALTSPVGIAIAAIAGLVTAFTLLWKNCESFRNFFINAFNSIKSAIVPIIENIKSVISSLWTNSIMPVLQNVGNQLMPIIQDIFGQLAGTFQACMPMIQEIGNSFADIFGALVEAGGQIVNSLIPLFQSLVSAIMPIVQTLISTVLGAIQTILPEIQNMLSMILPLIQAAITTLQPVIKGILAAVMAVVSAVLPLIQTAIDVIMPIVQTAIALISNIIQTVAPVIVDLINFIVPIITTAIDTITAIIETITPVIQSIITFVIPIIKNGVAAIKGVIQGITTVLQGIVNFVKGVFTGNWKQAWEGIKQIFSGVINTLKSILQGWVEQMKAVVEGIKNIWTAAGNAIKNIFIAVGSAIGGALSKAAGVIKSALTAAANAIKSVWNGITSFFSGIVSRIVGVFQSLPSKMVSIGKNMIQGIINGITGAAGALISKMKNLASSALNAAKNALGIHSPSVVMEKIIGKNIPLGIAKGIYKTSGSVTDAMKEISQNILAEAEEVLDMQKTFSEISEEQELEYWRNIRNITGLQGDELLSIDKKIAEKEKSILAAQQAEQEKYLQDFESRVDKIAGFADIFSEVEFETVDGGELTKNLRTQVMALEEYAEIMQDLVSRGIGGALLTELQEQGVSAIDELRALSRMNDNQLAEYENLYTEKMRLAAEQAAAEMGIASVGIVNSVAEAVETLNTNASVVVNQAENNQDRLLDLIATKTAEYVGNALLSGLVGIQDTILASMPETLNLNLDGKQVAQTLWSPLDSLGDKKNRLFAPSHRTIADIALATTGRWEGK